MLLWVMLGAESILDEGVEVMGVAETDRILLALHEVVEILD